MMGGNGQAASSQAVGKSLMCHNFCGENRLIEAKLQLIWA